ncbi:MAG: hypothetical protein QF599_07585, partial [Planctomycetota bacterium]|nr:hypothetical protein [Planctomycetota bacterium]
MLRPRPGLRGGTDRPWPAAATLINKLVDQGPGLQREDGGRPVSTPDVSGLWVSLEKQETVLEADAFTS